MSTKVIIIIDTNLLSSPSITSFDYNALREGF